MDGIKDSPASMIIHSLLIDDTEVSTTDLALIVNSTACTGDGIIDCLECPATNTCIDKSDETTQYWLNIDFTTLA